MSTAMMSTTYKEMKQLATHFRYSLIVLVLMSCALRTLAQDSHSHTVNAQGQTLTSKQSALLQIVRDSTARFQDVSVAEHEGYALTFGCVSGPDAGAMGLHYVNSYILGLGEVDATRPQIVIYEPTPGGRPKLTGADYLVFADAWDAKHPGEPPELMGQLFHYFESPNRFGLPAFYTLHVWAWKDNPNGAFVNWHPNVSCESFVQKQ
jgi:hypothetical protein